MLEFVIFLKSRCPVVSVCSQTKPFLEMTKHKSDLMSLSHHPNRKTSGASETVTDVTPSPQSTLKSRKQNYTDIYLTRLPSSRFQKCWSVKRNPSNGIFDDFGRVNFPNRGGTLAVG